MIAARLSSIRILASNKVRLTVLQAEPSFRILNRATSKWSRSVTWIEAARPQHPPALHSMCYDSFRYMKPKRPEFGEGTTQSVVLDRLLDPLAQCLTVTAARRILNLRADPVAQERIEELAEKSNEGELSPDERAEYELYVSTGTFIAILQAKARALLTHDANR